MPTRLRVREYKIRSGSGGKGQQQGGDGVVREIETLVPARMSLLSDRRKRGPYGLSGGEDGERGNAADHPRRTQTQDRIERKLGTENRRPDTNRNSGRRWFWKNCSQAIHEITRKITSKLSVVLRRNSVGSFYVDALSSYRSQTVCAVAAPVCWNRLIFLSVSRIHRWPGRHSLF